MLVTLSFLALLSVSPSDAKRPLRVLCFGDSLTAGLVSRNRFSPYADTLASSLEPCNVCVAGVPLESAHAMPPRLAQLIVEQGGDFDAAIVIGGSNDLWRGNPEAILQSLAELHLQIRNLPCDCALGIGTLPPFEPDVMKWLAFTGALEKTEATRAAVNAELRTMASRGPLGKTFIVDLAALCRDAPAAMVRPDGLHFTAAGYSRLGELAAEQLRICLARRESSTSVVSRAFNRRESHFQDDEWQPQSEGESIRQR